MKKSLIDIKVGHRMLSFNQVTDFYNALEWFAYTKGDQKERLLEAIQNSDYVVTAWREEKLIGLTRCISDDVSILYLQDIMVHPNHQRQGVGRTLLAKCLERYDHVRTKILLTDSEERQKLFYESLGYRNTKDCSNLKLNAFVQIRGVKLE